MSHRRALLASAAAGVLVLGGAAYAALPASAAAAGCSVTYQNLNTWQSSPTSGGFTTSLAVTNLGDPVSHWTLTFTLPAGQTRTSGWNATFTGSTAVTATDAGWNGAIGTGATNTTVGLQGEWTRSAGGSAPPSPFPQPTNFALNGVACTGSTTSPSPSVSASSSSGGNRAPTVSLTSPTAGQTYTAPATVNFAATASDADGTVARVDFLNGSTVVGSDTTAPYTYSWGGVAAGTYSVGARAVDNAGATTTTTPISIRVNPSGGGGAAPALHVSGNKLLTASGATYRLLGVNRASSEFACVQGKGMWDSPTPDQASVDAMKAWNIHAVRIPLNEDCWLGTFGTPSGATYQQAVKDYVDLLVANGINPIVEMHWNHGVYTGNASACSDANATCQKPMPDAQYAPTFWTQVATAFKGNNAVVFDLFNEPYPDAANNFQDATAAWKCLRDGGTCTGITYQVAGTQSLVNAVRATGATNVIMSAGLTWTNDLTQWLTYKPTDSTGNLMASWHSYNFNGCITVTCWDSQIGTVAAQVPVVAGEIGQNTCAHDYIDQVMTWADAHGVGYLAWTWNPWGVCNSNGNVLITDYNGTPTSTFGEGFKAHLLTQNP
ncbi:cellulase family glycosylhydrolase [Dactylosporangium sp. NPDC049140]|uniref:cellulase family glycosylhydrolase n=1 Tax=Dactylosporangium sp. NPDC049140 TaxID=3155647 RepID=UPI0033E11EA8